MAGRKNKPSRRVMRVFHLLRHALRRHIPQKYQLRFRILSAGYHDYSDIIIISDYFRGKNMWKRWDIIDKAVNNRITFTQRFGINYIPFTEKEAQERGL